MSIILPWDRDYCSYLDYHQYLTAYRRNFQQQKDNDSLLEFILAYPDSDTAIANVNVLQARLNESYTPYSFEGVVKVGPLSQFWSVQSVKAEGALLHTVVKLTEQAASSYSFPKDLIQYDYLFLYPGSSDSIS